MHCILFHGICQGFEIKLFYVWLEGEYVLLPIAVEPLETLVGNLVGNPGTVPSRYARLVQSRVFLHGCHGVLWGGGQREHRDAISCPRLPRRATALLATTVGEIAASGCRPPRNDGEGAV